MIWKICSRAIPIVVFASLAYAVTQNPAPQPATPDPGQVTLNRACTVCHALTEVTKFKGYYNRDQWADIVRTMRADGAQLKDDEVKPLVDYLFKTYGKVETPAVDGKKLLESSCSGCHDLSLVTGLKLSKSEWQDQVDRMIGKGAAVEDAQVPTLVDYLFKTYGP
jgi:cytochrome c5